jgi:CRISPR-associated protein Csd2
MSDNLLHNIISLPEGKTANDIVGERHDIVFLFDATKANPNGDPDAGNTPRLQPDSLKGLVTDVCLKRKVRNFFSLYNPDGTLMADRPRDQYRIFIRENAILKDDLDESHQFISRRFFSEVLEDLKGRDYITAETAASIGQEISFEDFPDKPKKVKEFVFGCLKGYVSFAPLLKEMLAQLENFQDVSAEVKSGLTAFVPADEDQKSEDKMLKAILDKAKKHAAKGEAKLVEERLKQCYQKVSPQAQIADRFAELNLEKATRDYVCWSFFDNRAFGCVISTKGPLEGSFYGQVRGPIQISFAESLDKILQLDATITRCAVASKDELETTKDASDAGGNRTMGRKYQVDYGLYRSNIFFSPAFAAKTKFTYYDLDNFLFALKNMFRDDSSAARPGGLRVVGLVDFQHVSALGNEQAHKLFEKVVVTRTSESLVTPEGRSKDFPASLADYQGTAPEGIVAGHEDKPLVIANRLVWEIPAKKTNAAEV